jgi:hypothetical protein
MTECEDLFFEGQVRIKIDLRRLIGFVPKPDGDERSIYTSLQQFHSSCVSQHMRRNFSPFE